MATSMRLYSRLALVGFWSLLFGGVVVVLVAQSFSMLATASPTDAEAATGLSIGGMAEQSLLPLFTAGIASVAVGLILVVLGVFMLRSMVRTP